MKKSFVLVLGILAAIALVVSAVYVAQMPPAYPRLESIDLDAMRAEAEAKRAKAQAEYHETLDRIEAIKGQRQLKKQP